MASSVELWYIRLPDGRVLRARGTDMLRRILKTGRIPWESRVRRSPDDPWQTLVRTAEFADLVPADTTADEPETTAAPTESRATATPELRTLGMRGLVDELFNAFDSSLQHDKLTAAAVTGLAMGVVVVLGDGAAQILSELHQSAYWVYLAYVLTGIVLLFLLNLCTSILAQMTALELSRFRPAHFNEIRPGMFGYACRLTAATTLVAGLIFGLGAVLRMVPGWLHGPESGPPGVALETFLNVVNGARLLLEVICWPIVLYAMLMMGPIYVVEDCSIGRGLREWIGMLKQHVGRIYLYQAVSFAFALVLTLPLILPVLLAFGFAGGNPRSLSLGESVPFYLLAGVALTPALSYLLVAHVFIYLNLRYEFYSARDR